MVKIILFESFTGGLIAPESDNNLWNYKFTWNPRNVVIAGQGGAAKFIQRGNINTFLIIVFSEEQNFWKLMDTAVLKLMPTDSLKYQNAYNFEDINTLYRGTIKKSWFL